MRLKCHHRRTILLQTAAPKSARRAELWQICPRTPKSDHFLRFCQGGTKGNCSKKKADYRGFKNTLAKLHHLLIGMRLKCNHRSTFCCNRGSKSARRTELWQIWPRGHLNRPFSEILPRGDQGKMLKKVRQTIGAHNTWRKLHHLLIGMRLKCNHRRTFCCYPRLQKCRRADLDKFAKDT